MTSGARSLWYSSVGILDFSVVVQCARISEAAIDGYFFCPGQPTSNPSSVAKHLEGLGFLYVQPHSGNAEDHGDTLQVGSDGRRDSGALATRTRRVFTSSWPIESTGWVLSLRSGSIVRYGLCTLGELGNHGGFSASISSEKHRLQRAA